MSFSNCIVEVDEIKIGKNKHNRGHVITEFWAVGIIERTFERRKAIIMWKEEMQIR